MVRVLTHALQRPSLLTSTMGLGLQRGCLEDEFQFILVTIRGICICHL